jgi:hypothetical protein
MLSVPVRARRATIFDIQVQSADVNTRPNQLSSPLARRGSKADGLHDHLLLKVDEKLNEIAVVVPKGSYPKGGMLNTASGKSAVIKI